MICGKCERPVSQDTDVEAVRGKHYICFKCGSILKIPLKDGDKKKGNI